MLLYHIGMIIFRGMVKKNLTENMDKINQHVPPGHDKLTDDLADVVSRRTALVWPYHLVRRSFIKLMGL